MTDLLSKTILFAILRIPKGHQIETGT